jgi:hypothetical protein
MLQHHEAPSADYQQTLLGIKDANEKCSDADAAAVIQLKLQVVEQLK